MGKSSCCCTKPILILVNLIFCLVALAVLVIGIIVHIDVEIILKALTDLGVDLRSVLAVAGFDVVKVVESSSIYLIVIGAVLAVISFCGLCGACCESKCLLILYITALVVLLISQITMVILAIVIPEQFQDGIEDTLFKALEEKFDRDIDIQNDESLRYSSDVHELGWANFQIGLECCGSEHPSDYQKLSSWNNTYKFPDGSSITSEVPATCCRLREPKKPPKMVSDFTDLKGCLNNDTVNGDFLYYERGCVTGLIDFIDRYSGLVIGIAAGIAAFQVLLIVFAVCICRDTGRSEKTV